MTLSPPSIDRGRRVADRLAATRRARFVGRRAELETFRALVASEDPPCVVLHVFGPGGVGKTTLLQEYARLAAEAGRQVVRIDGRAIEPTPVGFVGALRQELGLDVRRPLADWPSTSVLLVDTYETLAPLDAWLREQFLPDLPMQTLVVLAGRNAPAAAWRTDLGWSELTRMQPLRNLHPEESRRYLTGRGIAEELQDEIIAITHGHPLALALVASAVERGESIAALKPEHAPDVVRVLLERLVQEVPSPEHRRALAVAVIAWAITESLLAETLQTDDAHALFAWLSGLPFMEIGPHGIYPHDLARDVLDADLRWRDPDAHRALSQQVVASLRGRLQAARGELQQRIWCDLLYLTRRSPAMANYFDWSSFGRSFAEPAASTDHPAILAMVRRHQGEAGERIAAHWLQRHPDAFLIYRESGGEPFGFMAHLPLHEATPEDAAIDPAIPAALAFVRERGPVRPSEEMRYLRFWMHRDAYQGVSAALNLTAINASIHWTTRPKLAWNFIAVADPVFLEPHFTGIHIWRSPEADFEVDGQRYGVFAHDWRVEPPAVWLNLKEELTGGAISAPSPANDAPAALLVALSETAFAEALRQALRDYTRPDQLATSPLLRSRVVIEAAGGAANPATLQMLLREAAATLTANPKDVKLHRALWHTYFEPAPSQERAAELLGLPFNTYRYRLAKAIERITAWLWRRELDGPAG
jgi:hypothetical protein